MTERRVRRRAAQFAAITDAARSIVASEGLAALTMRRIAEAVDYSPASLYAHFSGREALLAELCRAGFAELRLALEAAAATVAAPRPRLVALASAYVRFAREHEATYRLLFMEDAALTKGMFAALPADDGARAFRYLVDALAELRATGEAPPSVDPVVAADVLWMVVHGIASLRLSCPGMPATDDARLISAAVAGVTLDARGMERVMPVSASP